MVNQRTTMALDNFTGESEESSGGPPRTTYYQFENPDHENSKEFDDPETAKEHFQAARYVQNRLGTQRHDLVGKFLVAVYEVEENDNDEELQQLVEAVRS